VLSLARESVNAFDLQGDDQSMGKPLDIDGKPITILDLWTPTPPMAVRRIDW